MKKFYLLAVALLAMATSASAQFVQSTTTQPAQSNTANYSSALAGMSTAEYARFYGGYNIVGIEWSDYQSELEKVIPFQKGFTLGYLKATNAVENMPIFLEYGANVMYSFGEESETHYEEYDWWKDKLSINMISVNVPINLSLKYELNNNLSVAPYVGANFRFNIASTVKLEVEGETDGDTYSESYDIDLLDDSDDEAWVATGRFQLGLNYGVGVNYNNIYIGIGQTTDLSNIFDIDDGESTGKFGFTTISVGINF